MKSQVLHTVWCNISGEAAREIWNWSLLGGRLNLEHIVDEICSICTIQLIQAADPTCFLFLSFSGYPCITPNSSIGQWQLPVPWKQRILGDSKPDPTQHFHSQEWSISIFPCSLSRNIASHSIKNFAFQSSLRWKMIISRSLSYRYPIWLFTVFHF